MTFGIPFEHQTKDPASDAPKVDPFTRDGLLRRLVKFVSGNDQVHSIVCVLGEPSLIKLQSINVVDDPNFRELLTYAGGGARCVEEDIPHWKKFTNDIIEAWKQERKVFAGEMEVRWIHEVYMCLASLDSCHGIEHTWQGVVNNRCLDQCKPHVVSWSDSTLYCT